MFMRYRGGGVGHKATRFADKILQGEPHGPQRARAQRHTSEDSDSSVGDDEGSLQGEDTDEEEGGGTDEDVQAEGCDDAGAEVDNEDGQGEEDLESDEAEDEGDLENEDLEDDETILDWAGYVPY